MGEEVSIEQIIHRAFEDTGKTVNALATERNVPRCRAYRLKNARASTAATILSDIAALTGTEVELSFKPRT